MKVFIRYKTGFVPESGVVLDEDVVAETLYNGSILLSFISAM